MKLTENCYPLSHGFVTGGPQEHFEEGHKAIWKIVKLVKILVLFISFIRKFYSTLVCLL